MVQLIKTPTFVFDFLQSNDQAMQSLKIYLFVLSACFFSISSSAQNFVVKGILKDTLNDNKLQYGSLVLIRATDSVIATFTRSKEDGTFELKPKTEGKYILMASFPGFADYVETINLTKSKPVLNLGLVPMVTKTHLLQEFVLKQQIAAIKIKGDTTEYMADSFKVKEGATVEELLKKLPGIQVNKNGDVVAQGETVQKILVDGEEFFTDDPAVVTKSLQAKAVEKVQVFDKKSDQSMFTGVDDGTREKTINLQLKDNMKAGYFGKAIAGGGTDGFFENQGMLNAFKGKRKISAFGIVANNGKLGLGWRDKDKFGGGNDNRQMTEDGFMISWNSDDDESGGWNGTYDGKGFPSVWTGGLHYSNKWLEDKLHMSSNYRYAKQNNESITNSITETSLGKTGFSDGGKLYSSQFTEAFSSGQRHRGDLILDYKIDSTSELKITANLGYNNTLSNSTNKSKTLRDALNINENNRLTSNDATSKSANATLVWRKKFQKQGRNLVLDIQEYYKESNATGYNVSTINYFNPTNATVDSSVQLDQLKINDSKKFQVESKFSYTEPLSKYFFLEMNYGVNWNNSSANKITRDKDTSGNYETTPNQKFSSQYDFDYLTNTGGANIRFTKKGMNFSLGGAISNTAFKQRDILYQVNSRDRSFTNFFPRATLSYRVPDKQKSYRLSYNGSTQQPTIEQIQPLQQNTDPLNISVGNPNLRQQFDHQISFGYNDFKVFSGTYTYLGGSISFVQDDISRMETITTGGQRIYQYVNIDGNYNGNMYGGYGFEIKKIDLRININGSINTNQTYNFINGVKNRSLNNTFSLGIDFNYDKEDKFNLTYNPSVSYNQNTATINTNNTNYWTLSNDFDGSVELPYSIQIGSNVNWMMRQKIAAFDQQNNVFLWNAYVSKKMLSNKQLELRIYANDILNQNIGFQRYGSSNTVTQNNYNTIRRYGMIQLTWNFTKTGGNSPVSDGAKMIIKN